MCLLSIVHIPPVIDEVPVASAPDKKKPEAVTAPGFDSF
jgi:hypothetical protein